MKKEINKVQNYQAPPESQASMEEQQLLKNIFRPDIEKFRLFTTMLRNNAILNKAVITHK